MDNSIFDENEDDYIASGLVAADTSMEAISALMKYYPKMLSLCFKIMSENSENSRREIKEQLERELGLEGVLEISMQQIAASKEVLRDTLVQWNYQIEGE